MATRTKSALEQIQDLFERKWRCEVFTSGYHNGCKCSPNDPHANGWDCGFKWIAPALPDHTSIRRLLDKEEPGHE